MLQLKGKKIKLFFYIFILMLLSTINMSFNKTQNYSIISIKKINVGGLSDLNNLKIEKSLNSLLLKNIFFVKKKKIKKIKKKKN